MFTVRFENHREGYESHSCSYYRVSKIDEGKAVMLFPEAQDDSPVAPSFCGEIGDAHPYRQAYVTNEQGKTVDKIMVWTVLPETVEAGYT